MSRDLTASNRISGDHFVSLDGDITAALNPLTAIVRLPESQAVRHVYGFLSGYADYASRLLSMPTRKGDLLALRYQILDVLERKPSLAPDPQRDMACVRQDLVHAYFVLRVVEEVNDISIGLTGRPVSRFEVSTANMIAMTVLGEEQSMTLEQDIAETVQSWVRQQSRIHDARSEQATLVQIFDPWPCLADSLGLSSRIL